VHKTLQKIIIDQSLQEKQDYWRGKKNGYHKGRSCMDSVFSTKKYERRRDFGLQTYMDLVDYVKALIEPLKQNPEVF
jgi:hypothetical protein